MAADSNSVYEYWSFGGFQRVRQRFLLVFKRAVLIFGYPLCSSEKLKANKRSIVVRISDHTNDGKIVKHSRIHLNHSCKN